MDELPSSTYIRAVLRICLGPYVFCKEGSMSFSGKAFVPMMLLLSCTVLSTLSFAKGDTDFSNSGGTLTGTSDGLSLSGSTLVAVIGWNGGALVTGNLGTVAFTTGALNGGSLANGGTFAAGGMFTVDGDGANGIPTGVLFSGSFSGTSTWVLVTLANGTHNYILTGVLSGTMGGQAVDGVTVQLTINTGKGYFDGSTTISGGDTLVSAVPEPSTYALFGIGTLAVAGVVRRKALAARS